VSIAYIENIESLGSASLKSAASQLITSPD
jgi:hypothetical protein